jgi:hypothetical protein
LCFISKKKKEKGGGEGKREGGRKGEREEEKEEKKEEEEEGGKRGILESLFPDKTVIPKTQFPQHIAWAFSDYEEPHIIKKDLEHSTIDFFLGKNTKTKKKSFTLTSIVYSDNQTLSIIY